MGKKKREEKLIKKKNSSVEKQGQGCRADKSIVIREGRSKRNGN